MSKTSIEWTDMTWNPVRGCSRVSEGCRNCYAERTAARFASVGRLANDSEGYHSIPAGPFHGFVQSANGHPQWTGKVELVEKHLEDPFHWKTPQRVFVNSMSDLWHEKLRADVQADVYAVMAYCYWHQFQILTKRPEQRCDQFNEPMFAREVEARFRNRVYREGTASARFVWPLPNVWEGISVEDQKTADERVPLLLQTPAALRFVSYEPALGPVDFTPWLPPKPYHFSDCPCLGCFDNRREFKSDNGQTRWLDWGIAGLESGPRARPGNIAWLRDFVRQFKAAGVPPFVKQFGAKPYDGVEVGTGHQLGADPDWEDRKRFLKLNDRKGGNWEEWEPGLRVREFPDGAAVRS